jgi:DNA topoisomerase I
MKKTKDRVTSIPFPANDDTSPEPAESARVAGLRYVSDHQPGIRRIGRDKHFRYVDADGKQVRDEATLARIRSLVIPPAWTDVWICLLARGHLQATGRDARGRKQYRYHPRWRATRDETKYDRMLTFGLALATIRKQVNADLARSGLPREKVLATVVRLLETTLIRVGNEEYARENGSYGLTTMQDHHVRVSREMVHFAFRGKSGVRHRIDIRDRRLARVVLRCQELPGHELFQYLDEQGKRHSIDSADVNEYLRTIAGQDYTAKDFRTWSGTVLAAQALLEFEKFETATQAKKNIVAAIVSVAARLGNTVAVCRKCYVHPAVFEAYLDGSLTAQLSQTAENALKEETRDLSPEEAATLTFLHLWQEKAAAATKAG